MPVVTVCLGFLAANFLLRQFSTSVPSTSGTRLEHEALELLNVGHSRLGEHDESEQPAVPTDYPTRPAVKRPASAQLKAIPLSFPANHWAGSGEQRGAQPFNVGLGDTGGAQITVQRSVVVIDRLPRGGQVLRADAEDTIG
jgi:hypothetical protein